MATLYLLKYNNYYNRIVKQEESISDYIIASSFSTKVENVNFIPNDFVDTTQIVNISDEYIPDYLLVTEDSKIKSRWFIVGATRTTYNQLQLTLHRDLIVDHYEGIVDSPAFIEKGTPLNIEESSIYNNEDMSFNQIKKEEIEITDETGCPWIVAYLIPGALKENQVISITQNDTINKIVNTKVNDWNLYDYCSLKKYNRSYLSEPGKVGEELLALEVKTIINVPYPNDTKYMPYHLVFNIKFNSDLNVVEVNKIGGSASSALSAYENAKIFVEHLVASYDAGWPQVIISTTEPTIDNVQVYAEVVQDLINKLSPIKKTIFNTSTWPNSTQPTTIVNNTLYDDAISYIQKITQFNDTSNNTIDNYYIQKKYRNTDPVYIRSSEGESVSIEIKNVLTSITQLIIPEGETSNNLIITGDEEENLPVRYYTSNKYFYLDMDIVHEGTLTIKSNNLSAVNDGSFAMICMPYTSDKNIFIYSSPEYIPETSKFTSMKIMSSLTEKLGSSVVADVQLLPYCPIRSALTSEGKVNLQHVIYSPFRTKFSNGHTYTTGVLFYCPYSRFQFQVKLENKITEGATILQKKINNETKMYRLCSPLYDGVFEFSPEKNGGVSIINVDCRYKPYTPYIHLAPDFGGLYGKDFDDARGLTVAGDFSIDQISNAWTDYQIQNKNYQRMFDRQIQNIEINNKIERKMQQWQIAAGVFQGAAQGYQMGSNSFMGLGGVFGLGKVGANIGAGVSLAAGLADLKYSDQLRAENLSYTKDQFNMQMQNIQALPNTLTKLSAFDMNVRYFPFIEVYECTEDEVAQLELKIKYSGMTIMRIGTISEYANPDAPYIQGYLIRAEGLNVDYHIVNAINTELKQGIFLYGYTEPSA